LVEAALALALVAEAWLAVAVLAAPEPKFAEQPATGDFA
jgi:hypothetical protein